MLKPCASSFSVHEYGFTSVRGLHMNSLIFQEILDSLYGIIKNVIPEFFERRTIRRKTTSKEKCPESTAYEKLKNKEYPEISSG